MTDVRGDSITTDGKRDVSISNVPALGKRDNLTVERQLPDGTREFSSYRNNYLWSAGDDWQERLEQWLCIREDHGYQALVTLVVFRLWSATTQLLWLSVPALAYVLGAALVVTLAVLAAIVVKSPALLAPASLRLFLVVVGTFA